MKGWLKTNLIVTLLLIAPAIGGAEGEEFGDYSSETLTTRAWQALETGDYDLTLTFTNKCIQLYTKDAIKQQDRLSRFAPKEQAFDYWALNDVGTCYFIMGEAYLANGERDLAITNYEMAMRLDPNGRIGANAARMLKQIQERSP